MIKLNNNTIMNKITLKRIIVLTIFSIAMGLLETAVVVYLRELFYSGGFSFPLNTIDNQTIALTEILREAATIIMLIGIGYMFGRDFITRFAGFLYSFAIWDIFYYIFLKLLLNWPESLFTWDVLFLIPVTWVGPVLAPVIVSLTMILYALFFIYKCNKSDNFKLNTKDWILILASASIILISFTLDNITYLVNINGIDNIFNISQNQLFAAMENYIPQKFNWWIFGVGELGLLGGVYRKLKG
jgi:hypothetical protein